MKFKDRGPNILGFISLNIISQNIIIEGVPDNSINKNQNNNNLSSMKEKDEAKSKAIKDEEKEKKKGKDEDEKEQKINKRHKIQC